MPTYPLSIGEFRLAPPNNGLLGSNYRLLPPNDSLVAANEMS